MTDPQSASQRLRDFLDAATPWLPDNHAFCHFGDDNRTLVEGGHPLLLGDIKHATDRLDQIRQWAATTQHGAAAAEILQLLGQPPKETKPREDEPMADYITTETSERYHTSQDCPAFRRGVLGNEAQGIAARPILSLTGDEAKRARQTPCQECLPPGQDAQ